MTIFASRTPRDLSHDPEPWVSHHGRHDEADPAGWDFDVEFRFDPRPEFDHVQHNEPNPILVVFRKQRSPLTPLDSHIWGMLNGMDRLLLEVVDGQMIGAAHIRHARKVLIRLRRLTKLGELS